MKGEQFVFAGLLITVAANVAVIVRDVNRNYLKMVAHAALPSMLRANVA